MIEACSHQPKESQLPAVSVAFGYLHQILAATSITDESSFTSDEGSQCLPKRL